MDKLSQGEMPHVIIIRRIEAILLRMKALNDKLKNQFQADDLRIAMVGLPGNTLHSHLLHFAMADSTITQGSWWETVYGPGRPNDNDKQVMLSLEVLARHSFFVFFLARQEWNFRKLVSHLMPTVVVGGKLPVKAAAFKVVYDALLGHLKLQQYIPMLDVCRHLRNSVHSNGIFISPVGKDEAVVWKGTTYKFQHLKLIDFVGTEVELGLVEDNIQLIEEMLKCSDIISLPYMQDELQ